MNNFFRALIAGWGAKKLGGGCLSTIIIFIVIYYALGTCNHPVHIAPQKTSLIQSPVHNTANVYFLQKKKGGGG
jgi:hypothetical protein